MTADIVFNTTEGCLKVVGEFTVYQAVQSHAAFQGALESADLRALDMSGVTDFDTAGLQILLCLLRDPRFAREEIKISPRIAEIFSLVQLDRQLLEPAGVRE